MDFYSFFQAQMQCWPAARERVEALAQRVQRRRLEVDAAAGIYFTVQYNPARIVSTAARVQPGVAMQRPCFLCAENRPPEQIEAPFPSADLSLLVNPFPILPHHFTLPLHAHQPQSLAPFLPWLAALCQSAPEGMVFFYNGPTCGASAPDHAHLQAGDGEEIPLLHYYHRLRRSKERRYGKAVACDLQPYPARLIYIYGTADEAVQALREETAALKDFNLLVRRAAQDGGCLELFLFPRRAHRPACYYAAGSAHFLISPGALDVAGLIITPREEDFSRLTAEQVWHILEEVGTMHNAQCTMHNRRRLTPHSSLLTPNL